MTLHKTAIIVAGGTGERMKSAIPKQFLELAGEPILMRTLKKFHEFSPDMTLVLVLPAVQMAFWETLCIKHGFNLPHTLVEGGATRFFSVKNGLQTCTVKSGLIAVHDGVRPLVSFDTIGRCFQEAEQTGVAVPVTDMIESVRKVTDGTSVSVDRNVYKLVQTPQVFRAEIIQKSYEQPFDSTFTDDASVVERAGFSIHTVKGNRENIKITNAVDLQLAEILLKQR